MPETGSLIRIIHTNDIHSRFTQMAGVASVIRALRAAPGADAVLTIDCGDHMDRMSPETEGTLGRANVDVMNATGYDAMVFGNNEGLTFTPEMMERCYAGSAEFPVIMSNLQLSGEGMPVWALPYRIIERGGLRIGLIGITACYPDFYSPLGWQVEEPISAAARYAAQLRDQTDLLVAMSHLGLPNDRILAERVPELDLILGGHTHHLLEEPLRIGQTWLGATGKFGEFVGEITVRLEKGRLRPVDVAGRVVPVAGYPEAEDVAALIRRRSAEAAAGLNVRVGRLDEALEHNAAEESPLGNLLAAALRRWTDAEIGLVNAGQLLGGLSAGPVTARTLLDICPAPINPCLIRLRGSDLLQALEESLLPEFYDKPIRGYGFRGKVLGRLCLDNAEVEYDPAAPPMRRIFRVSVGETTLDPDREYRIGTIDMFTFGVGYLSLKNGTDVEYRLPEFLRDLLRDQLTRPAELAACRLQRWKACTSV